jgi:hypothetical protein
MGKTMKDSMKDILGKQFLITSFIENRLQIVNFIKEGYDLNKPILMNNRFLHFTAHIYYRSIIVDLYSLFGKPSKDNKYSFLHITEQFKDFVKPTTIETVRNWIIASQDDINTITQLRHKQIAHYDFTKKESISLNFNNLFRLNNLYNLATRIISYYGESFLDEEDMVGYDFGRRHQYLDSLQRLINKASPQ